MTITKLNWIQTIYSQDDLTFPIAMVSDEYNTFFASVSANATLEEIENEYRSGADYDGAEAEVPLRVNKFDTIDDFRSFCASTEYDLPECV